MADPIDDREVRQRMERIESLLNEVEKFADPQARARTKEIVQGVLDLHGAALERLLGTAAESGKSGVELIEAAARDDLVGSVLLLHGLHPLDLEARVRLALDKVRPQLRPHGRDVELAAVADGIVRVRIRGSGGCASTAQTLKRAVEEAIADKAPDATMIDVEEPAERSGGPTVSFVPLGDLVRRGGRG